jgi:hypothetical protein
LAKAGASVKKPAARARQGKARQPKAHANKAGRAAFYLKTHVSRFSTVVAVCDRQCLGKKFESGGLVLDLATHRRFYEGELVEEEAVLEALCGAGSINIVGDRSVELAARALRISKAGAKRIGGVSHLQVYRV